MNLQITLQGLLLGYTGVYSIPESFTESLLSSFPTTWLYTQDPSSLVPKPSDTGILRIPCRCSMDLRNHGHHCCVPSLFFIDTHTHTRTHTYTQVPQAEMIATLPRPCALSGKTQSQQSILWPMCFGSTCSSCWAVLVLAPWNFPMCTQREQGCFSKLYVRFLQMGSTLTCQRSPELAVCS